MPTEECSICREEVFFSDTVHVLIHTRTEDGVVDHYICRGCYEEEVATAFEAEPA